MAKLTPQEIEMINQQRLAQGKPPLPTAGRRKGVDANYDGNKPVGKWEGLLMILAALLLFFVFLA